MNCISTLVNGFNQSFFGQTIATISAKDNAIGAVASVIFSRPAVVLALAYTANRFIRHFDNIHAQEIQADSSLKGRVKAYLSAAQFGYKKIITGLGALILGAATVFAATRKSF